MPTAFFFSISELTELHSPYNVPALRDTFGALLTGGAGREEAFELRQGDLLFWNLGYFTARVDFAGRQGGSGATGVRRTETADRDLLQTLIWDFCDAVKAGWHTFDLDDLPFRIGHGDVYALSLSALSPPARDRIDEALRAKPHCIGGFEPDPGNPVHRKLLMGGLIHRSDYRNGWLLFDPLDSDEPFDPPPLNRHGDEWYGDLGFDGYRYLTDDERAEEGLVPPWPPGELSERGAKTMEILDAKSSNTHMRRLADQLGATIPDEDTPSFSIEVGTMARAADAIVEDGKLSGYLLSLDHPAGGPKARWFRDVLAIGPDDAPHLEAQLKMGLLQAEELFKVRSSEYGVRYHVVTSVTGLNGRTAAVTSAWEVEDDGVPRFVTAHPGDRQKANESAPPNLVVPAGPDAERWPALWKLADARGQQAAARTVATPFRVGNEWVEGDFGSASIAVKDARRGFARWLVREGKASTIPGRGAVLHAPSHLHEEALAYANAFAEVLEFNGIDAEVTSRLN